MYTSIIISLVVQTFTIFLDILGFNVPPPKDKLIYLDLLKMDLVIEFIEYIFYFWMLFNISQIKNITPFRYFDWFITTPLMLLTLMAYMSEKNYNSIGEFIKDEYPLIINVLLLNVIMLGFGLLAELDLMSRELANSLGFIPFIFSYKLIYDKFYHKNLDKNKKILYWVFLVLWSFYGIASFLPYETKNNTFNILDIFSKNAYSLAYFTFITSKNIKL